MCCTNKQFLGFPQLLLRDECMCKVSVVNNYQFSFISELELIAIKMLHLDLLGKRERERGTISLRNGLSIPVTG